MRRWNRNQTRTSTGWFDRSVGYLFILLAAVAAASLTVIALNSVKPASDLRQPREVSLGLMGEAPEPRQVAVFIGDSYTTGAGSTSGGFVRRVATALRWDATNLGRGGTGYLTPTSQTVEAARNACARDYCESYPEMIAQAAALSPDVVVVSGGRNNRLSDPSTLDPAITSFYQDLREALPDARIIATSPFWDSRPAPESLTRIGGVIKSAVEGVNGEYIDLQDLLRDKPDLIGPDDVHPNEDGYDAIAEAMLVALRPESDD